MSNTDIPRFELRSVYDDGSSSEAELVPVSHVPIETKTDRRGALKLGGILGAGISASLIAGPSAAQVQKDWKAKTKDAVPTPEKKNVEPKPKPKIPAKVLAHRTQITTVAMSRDGQFLLSGDQKGKAKVWSLSTGKLLRSFRISRGPVIDAAFDDERKVLTVFSSRSIKRWSTDKWKALAEKKQKVNLKAVALSPDNRYAVIATFSKKLRVYPLVGEKLQTESVEFPHKINSLRISNDGSLLVVNSASKVGLYSLPDLDQITLIATTGIKNAPVPAHALTHVDISHDERFLAVAREKTYGANKGKISLWKLPDDALQDKLKVLDDEAGPFYHFTTSESVLRRGILSGHKNDVTALEFFSTGPFLVSGGKVAKKKKKRRTKFSKKKSVQTPEIQGLRDTLRLWFTGTQTEIQSLKANEKVTALALDNTDSVLASAGADGTIMIWDRQVSDGIPQFKLRTFLFDPKAMDKSKKAASFDVIEQHTGQTISYTLPCGSPIPAGAVCTCNCVPGAYSRPSTRSYRGRQYCSCNKICTCIPVCQAHRLLDDDPYVRHMSKQLLLVMGRDEFDYMRWASDHSDARLKREISKVMAEIEDGAQPDFADWLPLCILKRYLDYPDDVTAIMAAQMISLRRGRSLNVLVPDIRRKVISLLERSKARRWDWQ